MLSACFGNGRNGTNSPDTAKAPARTSKSGKEDVGDVLKATPGERGAGHGPYLTKAQEVAVACHHQPNPDNAAAHSNGHGAGGGACPVTGLSHEHMVMHPQGPGPQCPLKHGSVGVGPYPGYVHGHNPKICKHGCTPDPSLLRFGKTTETWKETLIREAMEYQDIYHKEMGSSEEVVTKRKAEIMDEIERTGTYTHTLDELQHGARMAWRNAPKCGNRKFWDELNLIDGRGCKTAEEMRDACLELLEVATLTCVTTTNILCFRPETPGTKDGPRVWNNQLLRFLCYTDPATGAKLGDPAEQAFTTMLQEHLGWTPPPPEKRTRFDVQPLVLQPNPDTPPSVFEVPPQYVLRVPLTHPKHPSFANMGLQWYAVPAVCSLDLTVGGLVYTACPFNGWYSVTEIVHNMMHEERYNTGTEVAQNLGIDCRNDYDLWKDTVMAEIGVAVMHSYREAGVGIVDHHTLLKNFWGWYNREMDTRGYCPGNWKWIIPPMAPNLSKCYFGLSQMTEYTLKPGYWPGPGWRKHFARWQELQRARLPAPAPGVGSKTAGAAPAKPAAEAKASQEVVVVAKTRLAIFYSTVTGTVAKYVEQMVSVMRQAAAYQVTVVNVGEQTDTDAWLEAVREADAVALSTCTYGPGAPPAPMAKFLAWVQRSTDIQEALAGRPFAVLGLGSSSYPRFCAAADLVNTVMLSVGAKRLLPVAKADAVSQEELVVWTWVRELASALVEAGGMEPAACQRLHAAVPLSEDGGFKPYQQRLVLASLGKPEGIQEAKDTRRQYARILEVRQLLQTTQGGASTCLIRMGQAEGPPLAYCAGDELQVFAENPVPVVEALARALGVADLDEYLMLHDPSLAGKAGEGGIPQPCTFRTALTRYMALMDPLSYNDAVTLAGFAPSDEHLGQLASSFEAYNAWSWANGPRWCDVFKHFPALLGGRLPMAAFFQLCPLIKPRTYSIASSLTANPGEVHLTVAKLNYTLPDGQSVRTGFCTTFLTSRQPGDRVAVKVLPTPGFRMPLNPSTPVVMVAAGAGLAPFKGFWEERLQRMVHAAGLGANAGQAVLVFGCRSSTSDLIYLDRMTAALEQGALSKLLVAYSREPGTRKAYVQDMIGSSKDELMPLLSHPKAHVFVCGSSNMAQEVASAFSKLMGPQLFESMVNSSRYHEDVFGMVVPPTPKGNTDASDRTLVAMLARMPTAKVLAKLDEGFDASVANEDGCTLLHLACQSGNAELVSQLLGRGLGVNTVDALGRTPLMVARLAKHAPCAALVEGAGGSLVPSLHAQFYPLHAAAMKGDIKELMAKLQAGADVNQRDFGGLVPLHVAVMRNDAAMVGVLHANGADTAAMTRRGMLPLTLAVALEHQAVADVLRSLGAPLVPSVMVTNSGAGTKEAWAADTVAAFKQAGGITAEELAAIQSSWSFLTGESSPDHVKERMEEFGVSLFTALFEQSPTLLRLFPFKDADGKPIIKELKVHGLKVVSSVGDLLDKMNNFAALARVLNDVIDRHIKYGVELQHYNIVLSALVATVTGMLKDKYDDLQASAWNKLMKIISSTATTHYASLEEAGKAKDHK